MTNFHIYFFNMDISLIMTLTCLKISTHDAKTHTSGSVSQSFDLGFSVFVLLYGEIRNQKSETRFPRLECSLCTFKMLYMQVKY